MPDISGTINPVQDQDPAQDQDQDEPKKNKGGRPRKNRPHEQILNIVNEVLKVTSHKKIRINHDEQTAGVDLGARGTNNGLQFRQLHVKGNAGFITVRLIEGFKPSHGGSEQRKTLNSVIVSSNETEAYGALQNRFFGYSLANNIQSGEALLDNVLETISKTNFN